MTIKPSNSSVITLRIHDIMLCAVKLNKTNVAKLSWKQWKITNRALVIEHISNYSS